MEPLLIQAVGLFVEPIERDLVSSTSRMHQRIHPAIVDGVQISPTVMEMVDHDGVVRLGDTLATSLAHHHERSATRRPPAGCCDIHMPVLLFHQADSLFKERDIVCTGLQPHRLDEAMDSVEAVIANPKAR